MGELESLLLVVTLIYLGECLVWVRRGAVAFTNWWTRTSAIRHPGNLAGNQRGGLLLANPFPPLNGVLLAAPFPFSLSSQAVLAFVSACVNPAGRPLQTGRYLPWEEIKSVGIQGRKVHLNGELVLTAVSPFAARRAGEWLLHLRALPQSDRAAAIRAALSASLDASSAARRLEDYRNRSKPIRLLSNLLFIYLFGVLPPLIWRYGFGKPGLGTLAGLLAFTIPMALLFRRAHLALFPGAGEERFKPFLTMLLAPPTAIRAPDLLGRHLLEDLHPVAIARRVCSPAEFQGFARRVLLDLRHPLLPVCPSTEPGPRFTERWFREAALEAVETFCRKEGLDPTELAAPPKPADLASRSYCPRCQTQFVTRDGLCDDCGGRPLQPFASSN